MVAYPRQKLENIFGEYISKLGLTQLRIAETEKYAHVTFFFNGGVETVFPGEDRVLIASPKVATYDLQPEMSAYQVTEEAVKRIESGAYDVIILNFANCDMVGHTGVYEAACRAVTAVDECVGRVVEATSRMGGVSLITADHGNAERMADEDGEPFTAHTTNLVPFYIVGASVRLRDGRLAYRPHHAGPDGPGKAQGDGRGDFDRQLTDWAPAGPMHRCGAAAQGIYAPGGRTRP